MVYVMTLSVTQDCMASNGRMVMNNGLEKMWKKGFPGQDLNLEPPEYGKGVLSTWLWHSWNGLQETGYELCGLD